MMSRRIRFLLHLCFAMSLLTGCASDPPPTPLERGEVALEAGDWRSAKALFAEALRADPDLARAWLGQARAQLTGRDPEGALDSLSSLAQVDRVLFAGEARASYVEGLDAATRQRLRRKQSEAALEAVRALAKLDPMRRNLTTLLGRALIGEAARRRWLGDRETALTLYREACRVVPSTLDAWVGAAEILLEFKRGKEALRLLEDARKTHPTAGLIRALSIQALELR